MNKTTNSLRELLSVVPDGCEASLHTLFDVAPNVVIIAALLWEARDVGRFTEAVMHVDGLKVSIWIDLRCEKVRIAVGCGDITVFWYYEGTELLKLIDEEND